MHLHFSLESFHFLLCFGGSGDWLGDWLVGWQGRRDGKA